jgi:hypothetical protein
VTLEQELLALKARVDRIEATLSRLAEGEDREAASAPGEALEHERVLVWLKAEGLIVEPPVIARDHAERWRTLSDEEKQQIRRELDHLPPGPMVSDIVIENHH